MREVTAAASMPSQAKGGPLAALLVVLLVGSSLIPAIGGSAEGEVTGSLPDWVRVFRLHEGVPSSPSEYHWLNSSAPQNPPIQFLDYDGDGLWGITIRKNHPLDRWRHFWVMDPPVNEDVRIVGDIGALIWAAARDNVSGVQMNIDVCDVAPGQMNSPDSWTLIGQAAADIEGPVYTDFKPYEVTTPSVDHTLLSGHALALTVSRLDSSANRLLVVYDSDTFDSYVTVPTEDFVKVTSAWAEDDLGIPQTLFSESDLMTVRANITNPFGSYDTADAVVSVLYASNGTTVGPPMPMSLEQTDPAPLSAWKVFSSSLGPLPSGSYTVRIDAADAQGSPSWMNLTVSVVTVDHFAIGAPETIVAGVGFEMVVTALDSADNIVPNWRGTVTLDALKSDTMAAGEGHLSVTEVEFTGAEGGVAVISGQTYSFAEEQIVIRGSSNSHQGLSDILTVMCDVTVMVGLNPSGEVTVTAGEARQFTATAYDHLGNVNTTWTPSWSVVGGVGSLTGSGASVSFLAVSEGTGTVTCTDPETGVNGSTVVTVVPGPLSTISVSPAGPVTIRQGVSMTFAATGYDSNGNEVTLPSPVWLTNTSGQIVGSGSTAVYTAGYISESGTVQVAVGSLTATVAVTVITSLNGPWLSTIPAQIAMEDSSWSLSLTSYWHHVNGTSGLMWFAEGVNMSLYMVVHDASSEAIVKFITQPDRFGEDTFRLWVRDPQGFTTYQDVQVSILPVNDRPRFVHNPPSEYHVKFDTLYTFDYDYYVFDVDNCKSELSMSSSTSEWGYVQFDGLVATFLFTEKTGRTTYFETMRLTLTDAPSGSKADSTNSDYLNIVVWVSENTPPSLSSKLPNQEIFEGDIDVLAFDLDDYFHDLDDDLLIFRYGFENIVVRIDQGTHEVFLSAPYEWSGVTDGTFTAVDTAGAFKTDTITVTVHAVNDPPAVVSPGTVHVRYEVLYRLDASMYVCDPDHSLHELTFTFDSEHVSYSGGEILILFPPSPSGGPYASSYVVDVLMTVEDPMGESGSASFKVNVSDNYAPTLADPVPYPSMLSFPEDQYLNGSIVLDLLFHDPDDPVLEYLVSFQSNDPKVYVTIYPDSCVNFSAAVNWSGIEVVTFTAVDPKGAWVSWSVTVVVIPVNDPPVITPIRDIEFRDSPRSFRILISHHVYDSETPYSGLVITTSPEEYVTPVGDYLYIIMPDGVNEISVTIYATDPEGARSNSVTFKITFTKTMAEKIGYPYTLPFVLLAAGVVGFFLASRIPRPYSFENLFLIHNDGRLVTHVTRRENTNMDKDVVSAMFTAVQEFVRDSFQQGEVGLKKLEIGDRNVVIEKGGSVYLAMIYTGWPPKSTFSSLAMLLRDIEERYGNRMARWNGTAKAVVGVQEMLQEFMDQRFKPGTWASEEGMGEEEWVDILSKES